MLPVFLGPFVPERGDGGVDQGQGSAEFVRDVGEEVEVAHIDLLLELAFLAGLLRFLPAPARNGEEKGHEYRSGRGQRQQRPEIPRITDVEDHGVKGALRGIVRPPDPELYAVASAGQPVKGDVGVADRLPQVVVLAVDPEHVVVNGGLGHFGDRQGHAQVVGDRAHPEPDRIVPIFRARHEAGEHLVPR